MTVIQTPPAEHLVLDGVTLARHPDDASRVFPDGEVYVQVEGVADLDRATVVHAGAPHPNRGLAYLYGVLDLLQEHEVPTRVCFTYPPYGRQDESFFDGTLNYARSLLRMLERFEVEHVYAVDAHFAPHDWTGDFPFTDIHALPRIEDSVSMEEYVVIGPDTGALERFDLQGFDKIRRSATDIELSGQVDVAGRDVLVFDDLIATGHTMVEAYHRLREQGADRVEAAAVHGVLQEGIERVADTYDALHLTNTVDRERATVDIAPLLRDRLSP